MITGGAFIAVFVLAIFMFAANFAVDNNSEISIVNDDRFVTLNSSLRNSVEDLKNNSISSQEMLFKTTLESGDEHSSTGAQFKIGPWNAMKLGITSFDTAFVALFGEGFKFIATVLITMLTFILGYFTIQAWLGRNPGS